MPRYSQNTGGAGGAAAWGAIAGSLDLQADLVAALAAKADAGAPSPFSSRTLTNDDNNDVLVLSAAATATVSDGLVAGFSPLFDATAGAITFVADGVTIDNNDAPHTGMVALVNIGTNHYRVAAASGGAGGAAAWGGITGTLSAQADLVAALAAKADLVGGKVPASQLPSYVDDVLEAANFAALPGTGETGKIYVTLDDNKTYRWSGSAYVQVGGGGSFLGVYATTTALQTAHPASSSAGYSAAVGTAAPYVEYVSDGSAWNQIPALAGPVTLTGATTLTRAAHANRQIIFNGANATLTIPNDATGGWTADDSFEVHTLNASAGVPTLVTPDGKSITGSATKIIGASRKGADQWTVGTTDPAVSAGGGTMIDMFAGNSCLYIALGKGSTSFTAMGGASTPAVAGTLTARSSQFASLGYLGRVAVVSAATANTNAFAGYTTGSETSVAPDTNALFPTQRARVVFGVSDALSGCRLGGGFFAVTPTATVEPSALTNIAIFAADSTDNQLTLMCNDGTGTATKTVLNGGTGFPANTNSADLYDCYLEFVGGPTRALNYYIRNRITDVKASGTVTTDLPVAGGALKLGVYRNTAANTTACAVDIVAMATGGFAQMGPTS